MTVPKPYELTSHSSGLQLIRVPRESTEAVTVQFFFRAGSRYEPPETNGLAHFTEHMVFKGAKHYPDFRSVNDAINQVGGYFNAYTSDEVTSFYVKAGGEKVDVALDVLSDILTEPKYDQQELDKERGVITAEIDMYEDDPASQLPILLDATLYPDHPLGRPILGPKKNIANFPRQAFIEYAKRYLTPDRGILVIAGQIDQATGKLVDSFLDRFGGKSAAEPPAVDTNQTKPALGLRERKTEQTHLGVALRGPSLLDREKNYVLDVLSTILGGNTSSRLFTEVRERQGLAYAVHSSPEQMVDTGTLDIYAGVAHDKAAKALTAILNELKRLRDGDLSEAELKVGKESLKGMRALRWEDSSALAGLFGLQQLLLGGIKTPHEILEKIDAVTRDQVITMADELVRDEGLTVGVLGPHKKDAFAKLVTVA